MLETGESGNSNVGLPIVGSGVGPGKGNSMDVFSKVGPRVGFVLGHSGNSKVVLPVVGSGVSLGKGDSVKSVGDTVTPIPPDTGVELG